MRIKKLLYILVFSVFISIFTGNSGSFLGIITISAQNTYHSKKTNNTSGTRGPKKNIRKKNRKRSGTISVVYNNPSTGEWIHRGRRKIVVHHDSLGNLRAMAPFSNSYKSGENYASIINQCAELLQPENINVYSLVAPTQGEFYMPSQISDNLSQSSTIDEWASLLSDMVSPVFVSHNLWMHREEDIYLHTDHHWSPLGAYYASAALANKLDVPFIPLNEYVPDTVKNFVGTMYNFSGDPKVTEYPEDFIYYRPPGDYQAEFIDYNLRHNKSVSSETPGHPAPIFRHFPNGSRSAYSTFLGGDNHTVKIINNNKPNDRKVLLVKDSYGNAMAPCLINSFEEVHVIDFRHYPHQLLDYVKKNGITDVVFVNCIELAFAPSTSQRLRQLIPIK